MPAMWPLEVVLRLVIRALGQVALRITDRVRRATGRYRTGYVDLPGIVAGGAVAEPAVGFCVARDPVFLPPAVHGIVARVAEVGGVISVPGDRGRMWTAQRAVVRETLPGWVMFGPSGDAAVAILAAAAAASAETIARGAGLAAASADLRWLIATDPWRAALLGRISFVARAWLQRPAGVSAPIWESFLERTRAAAFAAALVDELTREWRTALAGPWFATMGDEPTSWARTEHGSIAKLAGQGVSLIRAVDAHPNVALSITVVMFFPLIVWDIRIGGLLFLGLLALVGLAAAVTAVRRARTRRRSWRPPDFGPGGPPTQPRSLQRAMRQSAAGPDRITAAHLESLLARADVWIPMTTAEPADARRWLESQRRSGFPLPVAITRLDDGGRVVYAWTSRRAVHRGPRSARARWVCPVTMGELARRALEADAARVLLDVGSEASLTIERDGLGRFVPAADAEAATVSTALAGRAEATTS